MSKLFIIATPIGNLEDITVRAINILNDVDLILAEDTRVTKKLLERYNIKKPLLSYHQHSELKKINEISKYLKQGKNLALVSDAGTPGISDPGAELINFLLQEVESLKIIPIPGASALTSALSISGFKADNFIFLGFPPHKKARQKFFENLNNIDYTVIFYESPYRINKTLESLLQIVPNRKLVVVRELTKQFETVYRGKAQEILEQFKNIQIRGEFVVIIGPREKLS